MFSSLPHVQASNVSSRQDSLEQFWHRQRVTARIRKRPEWQQDLSGTRCCLLRSSRRAGASHAATEWCQGTHCARTGVRVVAQWLDRLPLGAAPRHDLCQKRTREIAPMRGGRGGQGSGMTMDECDEKVDQSQNPSLSACDNQLPASCSFLLPTLMQKLLWSEIKLSRVLPQICRSVNLTGRQAGVSRREDRALKQEEGARQRETPMGQLALGNESRSRQQQCSAKGQWKPIAPPLQGCGAPAAGSPKHASKTLQWLVW